ncbi:MAG: type II toxin-antitoxin system mRNA interferase toxin, RelE/StbE family [bacterium]|nr:type II toxin-antitoxin system mRNA interferase toxin, RelE/StbE family [bacterium]
MRLVPSTRFKKHYRKLPRTLQARADERLAFFAEDPFHLLLNNHPLHGVHKDKRSINIGGDYRIVYREIETETYLLIDIGTHSELYG